MSSTKDGPSYYTPTYGLPSDRKVPTVPTGTTAAPGATVPAGERTWRAPGVGSGRLQWEPLTSRNTPYPWEHQRPPEAWERTDRTVSEGKLPDRPAPLKAPEPLRPPDSLKLPESLKAPDPTPPPPPVDLDRTAGSMPEAGRRARADRGRPRPAANQRPPAPSYAPGGDVAQMVEEARSRRTQLSFPPPTGSPVPPRRGAPGSAGKKKGGFPWLSLLTVLVVFIEPTAVMLPVIAAMLLFATAKNYRNPGARIGWAVLIAGATVAAMIFRALTWFA